MITREGIGYKYVIHVSTSRAFVATIFYCYISDIQQRALVMLVTDLSVVLTISVTYRKMHSLNAVLENQSKMRRKMADEKEKGR